LRLSNKTQWASRWNKNTISELTLPINKPIFKERHQLFQRFLKSKEGESCLEVGAFPGTYLKYFFDFFGYQPWGVEYVESCAISAQENLNEAGVPAHVIAKDFFTLDVSDSPTGQGWDLTVSFGFVEHFEDSRDAVAKHIAMTRPGGSVVISIPNHSGINGAIMRLIDKEKWSQHNLMSLADLEDAVSRCGGVDVIFSGYVGHLGFWNAGLYSKLKNKLPKMYKFIRAPLWFVEWVGQWFIPNNRWTSPDAIVILRKHVENG